MCRTRPRPRCSRRLAPPQEVLGQECGALSHGYDFCEDVFTGIEQAAKLSWSSKVQRPPPAPAALLRPAM